MKISYPLNLPFQISQKWGENPEYYSQLNMKGHNGVDFAVQVGTPIYACHDGTVIYASIDSTMSHTVRIEDTTSTFETLYAHLSEFKVKIGDSVKRGDIIALSGNTGRFTTGPHLHMGVRPLPAVMDNGYNGASNPFNYFDGTYPNSVEVKQPVAVPAKPDLFKKAMFAIRELQIANNIMDFAQENNPKRIKVGPKTIKLINKLSQ